MRRLTPGPDQERGAAAVMVALLLTALFGFTAIALDVASLVQERRELQNGADAAALAVAKDCAKSPSCAAYLSTADTYADANASDGQANVDEVCGQGPGLPGCASPPSVPAGALGYVRAVTSTNEVDNPGDTTKVDYRFAPVLSDTLVGKTVRRSAVAAWGAPKSGPVVPLTMSACEFDLLTSGGTTFATPTGGTPPYSGTPAVIKFHSGNDLVRADDCAAQAGQDTDGDARLPGGFGWLRVDGDCEVPIDAGGWYAEEPGASAPGGGSGCDPSDFLDKVVLIAVFDDVNGLGGANGRYHLKGFAAFYVTGFRLGGSWNINAPCSAPTNCIGGYFVRWVDTGGGFGGPNLGVTIVKMIG